MRKHSPRKWLHAVLDLLPVILIPVFMIYSHRHDVAQDFVITENEPVYYQTNEVAIGSDFIVGNAYLWADNVDSISSVTESFIPIEKEYVEIQFNLTNITNTSIHTLPSGSRNPYVWYYDSDNVQRYISVEHISFYFVVSSIHSTTADFPLCAHIEPYYDLIKEYQPVVTNIPKDVMTSFIDRFNNTIAQYFNMGNVFNLNSVYLWFNTNIFGGNAPSFIYSVYNIIVYEFIMDILFLLYSVFMFIIDFAECCLEKPFHKTLRG